MSIFRTQEYIIIVQMNKNWNRKCSRIKTLDKVFGQGIHLEQYDYYFNRSNNGDHMSYRCIALKWESFTQPTEICTDANINFDTFNTGYLYFLTVLSMAYILQTTKVSIFLDLITSFILLILSFFQDFHLSNKESGPVWRRAYFSPLLTLFWGLTRFMDGCLFGGALGLFYFTVVILAFRCLCSSSWIELFTSKSPYARSVDHRKCQMLPNRISTLKPVTGYFHLKLYGQCKSSGKERSTVCWEHTKSH